MNNTPKQLIPIYLVVFFGFVGYALMITVYTPFILKSNLPDKTIILGLLLTAYPLGQFLGSPVIGALSDHYGRKPLLQITLALTAFMYIFIGYAIMQFDITWLIILCFITGLFESNVTLATSAIADNSNESNRTRLFGYINLAASAAYIVGPLLGGPLSSSHLVSWFSEAVPFWCVTILLITSTIYLQVIYHDPRKANASSKVNYLQALTNLSHVFRSTRFRRVFFLNFLLYTAIFGFFRSYPMYIVEAFHLDIAHESYFIAWVSIPLIIANLGIIGYIAKKYEPRQMLAYSALASGLLIIVVIIPSSIYALWPTLFFAGFAVAICLPATYAFVSFRASNDEQGAVMGNNNAVSVAGEASSGLAAGLLAAITMKLAMVTIGIVAIIAGFLALSRFIK